MAPLKQRNNITTRHHMRILESYENVNAAYLATYNVNLAFVYIPSPWLNPVMKNYRNAVTTIEQTCKIINTYLGSV